MNALYKNITTKRLKPTTLAQLLRKVKANGVDYRDMWEYRDLDDIFRNGAAIIFFPSPHSKVGHWCTIFKISPDTVEFFDSYGRPPSFYEDDAHLLTRLINNSYYRVYYNPYGFQTRFSSACGRHVINRLLLRRLSIDEYRDMMQYNPAPDFADDFVTFTTLDM